MENFWIIYLVILISSLIISTVLVIGMKWLYEKRKISKKVWKYLNKSMNVTYMALWFFIITIAILLIYNVNLRRYNVYVWWTPEQNGISNYCYEKKDIGKVCLVETKVNQFEKTRVIYK